MLKRLFRLVPALAVALVPAVGILITSALAATNAIQNGSFSQGVGGFADWSQVKVAGGTFAFDGYPQFRNTPNTECGAHSPALVIDVPGGADGYVQEQNIVVPPNGQLSLLSWGDNTAVEARISVVTSGNAVHLLGSYQPRVIQANNGTSCSGASPVTKTFNMSAFSGQTVAVRIEALDPTGKATNGSIADFTNVKLTGGSTAGSGPTGTATVNKSATSNGSTVALTAGCMAVPCTLSITLTAHETVTVQTASAQAARQQTTRRERRTIKLAAGTFVLKTEGPKKLSLKLTGAGKKFIHAHKRRVKVTALISETVAHHTNAITETLTLTIKTESHRK